MAVRLRLRRVGRKKLPIYKVVAADSRSPRDGRFIEAVGQYEPLRPSNNVTFVEERVLYWLRNGALPTQTVRNLLRDEGIWLKWSLLKKGTDEATVEREMERFALQREERKRLAEEKAAAPLKVKDEQKDEQKEEPEEVKPEPETAPKPEPEESGSKTSDRTETEKPAETEPESGTDTKQEEEKTKDE